MESRSPGASGRITGKLAWGHRNIARGHRRLAGGDGIIAVVLRSFARGRRRIVLSAWRIGVDHGFAVGAPQHHQIRIVLI